ncbi:hypothetical protein Tco_1532085 [Tanacetum coccineum]
MSTTNNNLQTQTSNALHNAIMEAGGKDRPPMLAPEGNLDTHTEGYMETYKNVSDVEVVKTSQEALELPMQGT